MGVRFEVTRFLHEKLEVPQLRDYLHYLMCINWDMLVIVELWLREKSCRQGFEEKW